MTIAFDANSNAWVVTDISELQPGTVINMIGWGQPYSPSDTEFDQAIYDSGIGLPPTLIFSNQDAMMNFGPEIGLTNFDVVKNFVVDGFGLPDGIYSFDDLVARGLAQGGDFGDDEIGTNLYGTGNYDTGVDISTNPTLAYIFGSVRFEIQPGAQFIVQNGTFTVNGSVGVLPDNFDYESNQFPANVLNPFLFLLTGPDNQNFPKVFLNFEGLGPQGVVDERDFCFPAQTPITLANGNTKPIADIRIGDEVLSFKPDGSLVAGTVDKLFRNSEQPGLSPRAANRPASKSQHATKRISLNRNHSTFPTNRIIAPNVWADYEVCFG